MNQSFDLEQMKQKQKKNIRLVLLILGGIVLVASFSLIFLNWLLREEESVPQKEIHFYPVVEGNIFENDEYLALNRFVYYCDDPSGYGWTTQITDEDRETFDVKVRFVEIYLNLYKGLL